MLYEPTNIIPSTFTQTGTVAQTDDVNIQWQVNGNSALTKFQIDIMQNTVASALVYSTGIISQVNQSVLPFYGQNRFGEYVPFVYTPNSSWAVWSGGAISDGNSYKLNITQFFSDNNSIYQIELSTDLTVNSSYYFSYSENGTTYYVSFVVPIANIFTDTAVIYYSPAHSVGWVRQSTNNQRIETNLTFGLTTSTPTSGTNLGVGNIVGSGDVCYNQFFTTQNAPAAFITRTFPLLSIDPFSTPVRSATQSFTASYSQNQNDAISSVRWQLYNSANSGVVVDDTGIVYTSILEYEYNGLFNNQTYTLVCTIVTQNNVQASTQINFSVNYSAATYNGSFNANCLKTEQANLLSWDPVTGIPGELNPTTGGSYSNGILTLQNGATLSWTQQTNEEGQLQTLNFDSPWTAIWKSDLIADSINYSADITKGGTVINGGVYSVAFSPDGNYLVLGGGFNGAASLFSVNGAQITYIGDLTINNKPLQGAVNDVAFSPNGKFLAICGTFSGNVALFSFSNGVLTYVDSAFNPPTWAYKLAFSMDSSVLLVGSRFMASTQARLAEYEITTSNTLTYITDITIPVNSSIQALEFNPAGNLLIVGLNRQTTSSSSYCACTAQVSGTSISALSPINNTGRYTVVYSAAFSPDGNYLVLGGVYNNALNLYSVSNNTQVNYIKTITLNGTYIDGSIFDCCYSPDGKRFIAVGYGEDAWTGEAYLFDVNGSTINFVEDITRNGASFSSQLQACKFSPLGTSFVLGGYFTDNAAIWSIEQTNINISEVFSLNGANISVSKNGNTITVLNSDSEIIIGTVSIGTQGNVSADQIIIALTPSAIQVYSFLDNEYIGLTQDSLSYTQQNITGAQLSGSQKCDYFAIVQGNGNNILNNLSDINFIPTWNSQTYTLDLFANFLAGLDGGTGTSEGDGFRIYRRNTAGTENKEIATLASSILQLKDYGLKSAEQYIYDFYIYDANGAFMGVKTSSPLCQRFKAFSLLSTQYNTEDFCYHVIKEYQFSCNIQDMTISNNSNKTYVQNFTPYPTVFKSTANYASGTLQALIGFVDKEAYEYWDSTQLMEELNSLSTTSNTLFLKDMKGHLWMIDVGTVQQTATQKTNQMQVTISLPWTEIGPADDVSIIQTPEDAGWNNDAQVLDVQLDVDVNSGLLQVVYPFPYNGTAFYLVGVTPDGVTTAVQPLPVVSQQTTDGQLTAVVRSK